MVKYKDLSFTAIIIVFAAVVNIYEVKNVIFELFPGHEQSRSVSKDVFGAEIMKLINSSEYSEIDEKFANISSNSTELKIIVDKIVNEIDDFHTSLEFAKKIKNPEISYLVLKNLWFEINSKNDTNLVESMNIYRTFHSKVIDVAVNEDDELKSSAIKLCEEEIRFKIQNESVIQLKLFLTVENFHTNDTKNFVELLFQTSEQIFDDVHKLVIDEIYEVFPLHQLVHVFHAISYEFPKNLFPMSYLISKNSIDMESLLLDPRVLFWIVSEKREFEKNHNLSDFTKNKYEQLIDYFPPETQTLGFSERLCIRSNITNEYICEASSRISNDSWTNHKIDLFTQKTENCIWKVDCLLKRYLSIQLSNHSGEYLFVDTTKMQVDIGTGWNFEHWIFKNFENTFEIYDTVAEVHLCISERSYLSINLRESGHVLHRPKECLWKVESC